MNITREQIHDIRSKLGTIALAADLSASYTAVEAREFIDIIHANVRAANEILDGLSEHEQHGELN